MPVDRDTADAIADCIEGEARECRATADRARAGEVSAFARMNLPVVDDEVHLDGLVLAYETSYETLLRVAKAIRALP